MGENGKEHIFVVDDEAEVRRAISRTLESNGYEVSSFDSARRCLAQVRSSQCDLLVTDVIMPDMDGIELLIKTKNSIPSLPVLVVTGYGDVEIAVRAMEAGASSLVQKPLERASFLAAVETALMQGRRVAGRGRVPLTKAEVEVLRLILNGKGNKEIARLRHRSVRTIEDQRHCIMRKFGVDNVVDLLKEVAIVRLPKRFRAEQMTLPFPRS